MYLERERENKIWKYLCLASSPKRKPYESEPKAQAWPIRGFQDLLTNGV